MLVGLFRSFSGSPFPVSTQGARRGGGQMASIDFSFAVPCFQGSLPDFQTESGELFEIPAISGDQFCRVSHTDGGDPQVVRRTANLELPPGLELGICDPRVGKKRRAAQGGKGLLVQLISPHK
jgi:hypothetical protein